MFFRKHLSLFMILCAFLFVGTSQASFTQDAPTGQNEVPEEVTEIIDAGSTSIFEQALRGGIVVFSVLLILVVFSVLSWAIFLAKYISLRKLSEITTLSSRVSGTAGL